MTPNADVSDLPPVRAHGALHEICNGVHYVEGTAHMGWVTFPRGMTVIVESGIITLVNPVRLNATVEADLLKLGIIKHLLCIGHHAIDVAYYVRRFGAKVYAFPERKFKHDVTTTDIRHGLPFSNARFIEFERLPKNMPEAVVVLQRDDGDVLIACDVVQNWENANVNWLGQFVLLWHGFSGKCIFDTYLINMWKKYVSMEDIKKDMAKLMDLEFRIMLTGHGYAIDGSAQEALHKSFVQTFGQIDEGQ